VIVEGRANEEIRIRITWSDGERQELVPRHAEINEQLAVAILRRAAKKE
jgi:hypothetical protein